MTGGVDFIYGGRVKLKSWRRVTVSCYEHCTWNENGIQ